jgi:hypothetical protein
VIKCEVCGNRYFVFSEEENLKHYTEHLPHCKAKVFKEKKGGKRGSGSTVSGSTSKKHRE